MQRRILSLAALLLPLIVVASAQADVYQWNAPGGGSFMNPNNWLDPLLQPGVPWSGDEAHFGVGSTYTVTLPYDHENEMLVVFDDTVDFDMGGNSYTVSAPGGDGLAVVPGFSGQLTIRNGGASSWGNVVVDCVGGNASMNTASDGSLWIGRGYDLLIGDAGTGNVTSDGTVFVTGTTSITAGSLLTVSGGEFTTYWIDTGSSSGRVNWTGGSFNLDVGDLDIGPNGPLGSSLVLDDPIMPLSVFVGTTTIQTLSDVTLAGGVFSTGALDYSDDPMRLAWLNGTLNLTNSDLVFGTGGLLDPIGIDTIGFDMELGINGTATVASDGMLFIDGGAMTVGQSTSHGAPNTLQIDSGGVFVVEGEAVVGTTTGPAGSGTFRIESDGVVDFTGGLLAADTIDLLPGGTITAVDPAPSTTIESTLRANALNGFGPGLTMPAFLNLQLGHSSGSASIGLSSAPLSLSGGEATLTVGYDSVATVTLDSGSTATMLRLVIGDESTAVGTVNVDGPLTTWDVTEYIALGGDDDFQTGGLAELNITGGSQVSSAGGRVGLEYGSYATVNVSGANSLWTTDTLLLDIAGWLYVGARGTGTVNIVDGGSVTSSVTEIASPSILGDWTGQGTVNVDGADSQLVAIALRVGGFGSGELNVTNGGAVDCSAGTSVAFGVQEAGSVTVASGSTLISYDASLSNDDLGGTGLDPVIIVRDGGSTWTNLGPLDIGLRSGTPTATTGADVIIEAGATLTTGHVSLGLTQFASGSLTVTDAGSTMNVTNVLVVGGDGDPFSLMLAGTGMLNVTNGGNVAFSSATILPAGVIVGLYDMAQGTATVDGSSSHLESDSPIWIGAVGGTGTMSISDGGLVTSVGATVGYGTGTLGASQGNVLVDNATWDNGSSIFDVGVSGGTGQIHLANHGEIQASLVRIYNGSQIDGNGQITGQLLIDGTAAPGNSPGAIAVTSSYTQTSSGTLEIDLAGTDNSNPMSLQYDYLDIGGSASLAGTLDVSLILSFVPLGGDSFEILTADGGISDTFATTPGELPSLIGHLYWNINYDTTGNRVLLEVISPYSADFDRDGDVDNSDLGIWEAAYGSGSDADADGDGDSDGADFLAWQLQFTGDLSSLLSASAAVPEPSTVLLLLAAAGCLATARWK